LEDVLTGLYLLKIQAGEEMILEKVVEEFIKASRLEKVSNLDAFMNKYIGVV